MKVPAESDYVMAYSISNHPQLGPVVEGYVIQLTSTGNLSLVYQRVHANNADFYDKRLDQNDYAALKLLDECSPEFIVKKFSKVKKIRPKEFFDKYFDDTLFKKFIRPHIEQKLVKAMKLIKGKRIFLTELKNVIYEELEWCNEPATALFHLRRNDDNTHYFATVKYDNQRIHFTQNSAILLTEQPCYLVTGNKILYFDDSFDGQKILPFIHKRYIDVPRKSEELYLRKVIVPLLEKYPLYAVGYEVISEKYVAKPVLKLTSLFNGDAGVILMFRYGNELFRFDSGKAISVKLEKTEDSYRFTRIKRSLQWEQIKKDTLMSLDITHIGGAEFGWNHSTHPHQVVQWVSRNAENLEKAGFEVLQDLDVPYAFELGELKYELTAVQDWFDVKATVRFGEFEIPFVIIRKLVLSGKETVQLPDGRWALIPPKWIEQIMGLEEFSVGKDELQIKKQHLGLILELQGSMSDNVDKSQLESFQGVQSKELPRQFEGTLRTYQKAGYDWLFFLKDYGFGGCLADDMGLGKTVQTLAFLQKCKEESVAKGNLAKTLKAGQLDIFGNTSSPITSLLVVPTSLIHNWYYEAKKFTPDLKLTIHTGPHRPKSTDRFGYFDVILTTYGTLRNDLDIFQSFHFETIILDESQFIKNPTSKLARAVYLLKAKTRLALTGTPVENSITDLWSQMNYSNPGLLGGYKAFQKNYVTPIEKEYDVAKTNRLHAVIKPFVLRRTKSQVAPDLPPKTEQIVYCDMTEEQEDIYEKTKSSYRNLILDALQAGASSKSGMQILNGLTKLRQIANHPSLENPEFTGESGKFQQVEQMLFTALEEDHKVLLFSQFVGHLQMYRDLLDSRGIEYAYIDGATASAERQNQVKRFQSGQVKLFLISLKAGGFGLNLTAADYVFLLDPWWNPAAENQAIDRAHRIGQTQNVFSYKFVTNNTVEEKIIRLQEKKRKLSSSLIKTDESYIKNIDIEELREIFT